MPLDTRYIPSKYFQEYLIDKDTGLPLAGGVVTFYSDTNRTVLKNVYQISGSPPNYTYSPLPNPLILSSIGTFMDNAGNDVIPYFYPYDDNGNIELYYIVVQSADSVFQFTREGEPNLSESELTQSLTNFIPNGQFLLHNNLPADSSHPYVAGEVRTPVTILGQGGWTYERTTGSTAKDLILFPRNNNYVTDPPQSPRYELNVQCVTPGLAEQFKALRIKFRDVNKFASDTQIYTFGFFASAVAAVPVTVNIRKYFGVGGHADVIVPIGAATITTSNALYQFQVIFGNNTSYTIGPNNDDYVQIQILFPTGSTFNATLSDFALVEGDVDLTNYMPVTNAEMISQSVAGWLPTPSYDGMDNYLPLVLTPDGAKYDDSSIGKIYPCINAIPAIGELLLDGSVKETAAYSGDGIPYLRLQQKLWDATNLRPIFGTSPTFVHMGKNGLPSGSGILKVNASGVVTNPPSDGATPTGFTFKKNTSGTPSINFYAYTNAGVVYIYGEFHGNLNLNAGTTSFVASDYYVDDGVVYPLSALLISLTGLNGSYFTIDNDTTSFYVWFDNGTAVDPAPGGTGIHIEYSATDTVSSIAEMICAALNGQSQYTITFTAITVPFPAGAYFNFYNTSGDHYIVWYKKDGVGSAPVIAATKYIEVDVLSTDTNAIVASKTITAVNSVYYTIPNAEHYFIRLWGATDPNNLAPGNQWRHENIKQNGGNIGLSIGSAQDFAYQLHRHTYQAFKSSAGSTFGTSKDYEYINTTNGINGDLETRPLNIYFNAVIKY